MDQTTSQTADEIAEEHHVRGKGLGPVAGPRTFRAHSGSVWPWCNRIQSKWGLRLNTQGFPFHTVLPQAVRAKTRGPGVATRATCLPINDCVHHD